MCNFFHFEALLMLFTSTRLVFCNFTGEPSIEIIELATRAGYSIEKHELLTDDGYFLDIFRLPPACTRTNNCSVTENHPVLVMHGLLGTSEHYLISGNSSLGFYLNDRGHDVWLGNARGTWHSRRHQTLDPDRDNEFWKFTWHEISVYDIPVMIDHILNITGRKKVSYIGHSQGCANFYVLCSERPEYNEKLSIHISLAPATFLSHTKNTLIQLFLPYLPGMRELPERSGVYELKPIFRNREMYRIAEMFCITDDDFFLKICRNILNIIVDNNGNNIDEYLLPHILEIGLGGSSIYQLLHFLQNIVEVDFGQYDWGREMNLKKYNSEYPKSYNFSMITVPVALYYGSNECVVVPEDIRVLASLIPNLVDFYEVPNAKWAHLDFLWGRDVVPLVYERIARTLNEYVRPRKIST